MKFDSTAIFVNNIEKSRDFYTKIMGLEILNDFGKNISFTCGIAIWEIFEEHEIPKNLNTKADSNKFELYFEEEDLESLYVKLKENKVKLLHEIKEEPWGQKTIRFFDPDNHLIEVGEPFHTFILNMYNSGMTPEEIHQKSGVGINTINEFIKNKR